MPDEPTQTLTLPGLAAPVEILRDRWGICHIRADNDADLFFAQGFNAARTRLWQIDLWRKRGLGLLAADFGPGYLEQDRAARAFLYRGDMAADWATYAPDAEAICTAFTRGINAYIDAALAGDQPLPPEFAAMDTRPAHWHADDIARIRSHALTRNLISEVARNQTLALHGEKTDLLREELTPRVTPTVDPDVPAGSVPLAALDTFLLATATVTFSTERLAATAEEAARWTRLSPLGEVVQTASAEGSNNWVVGPARTATGRPIMASDPHRAHALPSIRYLVHLKAPGIDVIGAGEPCLPGIAFGHNGHSAFSFTIFCADQEDMYVYDTHPDDPDLYRYGEGWERMTTVAETIPVRGAPDVRHEMRFTRHGPVVHRDGSRAFAVRTVWTQTGSAPYLTSLSVMRAKSHEQWRDALRNWAAPTLNQIYADVTGTIAWQAVGTTPVRPNWNGLAPVPGDGRYEWQGALDLDRLPHVKNPDRGFIATANEHNIPAGWDPEAARTIGYEWIDRSRADRLHAVLDADPAHTLEAAGRLQNDHVSGTSARLVGLIAGAALGPGADAARDFLSGFDARMSAESAQALFLEYWVTRHLKPALYRELGNAEAPMTMLWPGSVRMVLEVLENPEDWLPAPTRRDAILTETLSAAWSAATETFGPPEGWRWGDLHQLPFRHALAALPGTPEDWTLPPLRIGGNANTPNYGVYRLADFQAIVGPSVRLLMDVGDWDNSRCVNLPGQSGDPASPHYGDLAAPWLAGDYVPLSYSDAAVEAVTEHRVTLRPA